MKIFTTKRLCRAGIIAAAYVALTLIVLPVASGAIQFRPSEALTILPLFFIEAIPALFVGCLIANIIAGCTIADILLGSLVSLIAATITYIVGRVIKNHILKVFVGGLAPIVLNAIFLPLIWLIYGALAHLYILEVCFLLVSQSVAIYVLGFPLYFAMKKTIEAYPKLFEEKSKKPVKNEKVVEHNNETPTV